MRFKQSHRWMSPHTARGSRRCRRRMEIKGKPMMRDDLRHDPLWRFRELEARDARRIIWRRRAWITVLFVSFLVTAVAVILRRVQ